jgi:hypothetical protein
MPIRLNSFLAVIFNIILLVIVCDPSVPKVNLIYVTPVNLYVTIFGVVFATGSCTSR